MENRYLQLQINYGNEKQQVRVIKDGNVLAGALSVTGSWEPIEELLNKENEREDEKLLNRK